MNESYVRNVIEAALLAAGTPLPVAELTRLFEDSARPSAQQVRAALAALGAEYSGRGIELKETASGFRIQVRRELAGPPDRRGTTREFLDYFGLQSLDELPPLAEIKAMGDLDLSLGLTGEEAAAVAPEPAAPGGALPDSADGDDSPEDDELSAEGDGSRELVAGPRDLDG